MIECDGSCCGNCGQTSEPVVIVADDGTAEAAGADAEASVEVARIEADRDVAVAKIENRGLNEELVVQLAAMAARIEVLEAAAIPEPEPEPIVMPMAPAAGPAPEAVAPPIETAPKAESKAKAKKGFFG
jgi:hypothetical protein